MKNVPWERKMSSEVKKRKSCTIPPPLPPSKKKSNMITKKTRFLKGFFYGRVAREWC